MVISDLIFEEMKICHLEDVVLIERAVFLNPWTYDMYKAEVLKDYSHHYVVKYGNELVAFFGFFNTSDNEAEVTNIAVKPTFQGKHIGNYIMDFMFNKAREFGINKIFLETRATNLRAQHLYEKHGFKLLNIRKKYYDGVEDAYIYIWENAY